MTGRGAWNVAGVGGTKKYKDETKPGPYYFLGTGEGRPRDNNERAVKQAVRVYQRQLNARVKSRLLDVDGVFGSETLLSVLEFQDRFDDLTSWGGIGELTSEYLLRPYLKRFVRNHSDNIPAHVVSGLIRTESLWDVGAVGYQDDRDVEQHLRKIPTLNPFVDRVRLAAQQYWDLITTETWIHWISVNSSLSGDGTVLP